MIVQQPDIQRFRQPTADDLVQLEEHVRCRLSGRVRDFRLLIRDDGLILQGHASTYYAKQLAQEAVMQATTMRIRANEIAVF